MSSTSLYVKLDPLSFERLRKVCAEERRTMGDHAAILLRDVLKELAEHQATEPQQTVAA